MKYIKKLLFLIIIISSISLTFSFSIKDIFLNTITPIINNNIITKEINNVINEEFSDLNKSTINKINSTINNSKELNEITKIYFDSIIKDITNDTYNSPNIKEYIDILIDNNLPSEYSYYKNIINDKISNIDFDESYSNILNYTKTYINSSIKTIIDIYNILTLLTTKIILSIIILVSIILIIIINKSIETLKDISKLLNIIAIIQIVISLILKGLIIYINLNNLIIISVSELLLSFILDIIYSKINKKSIE